MRIPKVGPAFLVTAAFIGPGTVVTASMAGANYGFSLLWAILFSVLATLILQEMTGRLGIVTQRGLGENLVQHLTNPIVKFVSVGLVVSAIVIGNAAYEGGNIAGASLGLNSFAQLKLGMISLWPILIGLAAFLLLATGSYKIIETVLVVLVFLMSLAFILTFLVSSPDLSQLFSGLFIPSLPDGATLTVIALIGTTVVPYNLFLHASSVSKKWQSVENLSDARNDLLISVPLGGLITLAIVSTGATAFFGSAIELKSAADIAPALQPVFGEHAEVLMAIGLFAAGISSSVTAPLAAAYALSGVLEKNWQLTDKGFKAVWMVILILGVIPAAMSFKPVSIIWFAQVANGIMLPLITGFLLYIMNSSSLDIYKNNRWQNALGLSVFVVTLILSARSLSFAFGLL